MNLDTVLQSIDASFRALHKRDTAAAEQLGRNAGFLNGFAEGVRNERNLGELKRRLADGPDVSAMPLNEYAFYVAKLRDEIDSPLDSETAHFDRLRDLVDGTKAFLGTTDDDAAISDLCTPLEQAEAVKTYLYTVKTDAGETAQYKAQKHLSYPLGHDFFTSLHLYDSLFDSYASIKIEEQGEWTREEIKEPDETP